MTTTSKKVRQKKYSNCQLSKRMTEVQVYRKEDVPDYTVKRVGNIKRKLYNMKNRVSETQYHYKMHRDKLYELEKIDMRTCIHSVFISRHSKYTNKSNLRKRGVLYTRLKNYDLEKKNLSSLTFKVV